MMFKKMVCLACVGALMLIGWPAHQGASAMELIPPSTHDAAAEAMYEQALALHQEEKYEEELKLLTQALGQCPFLPEYRYQRALAALAAGELELAQQDCNIALAIAKDGPDISDLSRKVEAARVPVAGPAFGGATAEEALERADSLYEEGNDEAAIAELDKAIAAYPEQGRLYGRRAYFRAARGVETDKALTDFTYALRYDGLSYKTVYNCGLALKQEERYDEGLAFIDLAIMIDPEAIWGYYARGNNFYARGDFEAAIPAYSKCVELAPEEPLYVHDRGDAYFYAGRYEEALADYQRAFALNPDDLNFLHACVRTVYMGLQTQATTSTFTPSPAQLEMVARLTALSEEGLVFGEPIGEAVVSKAGLPVYPLAPGVNLTLFALPGLDMENLYLLSFDDPATLQTDAFASLWLCFAQAVIPEADLDETWAVGGMMDLSDPAVQGSAWDSSMHATLEGWSFHRLAAGGAVLIAACPAPISWGGSLVFPKTQPISTEPGVFIAQEKNGGMFAFDVPEGFFVYDYAAFGDVFPSENGKYEVSCYWMGIADQDADRSLNAVIELAGVYLDILAPQTDTSTEAAKQAAAAQAIASSEQGLRLFAGGPDQVLEALRKVATTAADTIEWRIEPRAGFIDVRAKFVGEVLFIAFAQGGTIVQPQEAVPEQQEKMDQLWNSLRIVTQ